MKEKVLGFLKEFYADESGSEMLEYVGLGVLGLVVAYGVYKYFLQPGVNKAAGTAVNTLTNTANGISGGQIH